MEIKHNKKRNIGLLSEFFSRYIGEAFLDGRHNDIQKAKDIWERNVHSESETYKELQIFNALHDTNVGSKELALSLFERTRDTCKNQKQNVLDKEKEQLINEVNNLLNDKLFFEKNIPDYKSYASVQVLMNAWRGIGFKGNLSELISLEETVLNHVLKNKNNISIDASGVTSEQVDSLVLKIMTEKFNAKYGYILNETQKQIINIYTLSERNTIKTKELTTILENLRNSVISTLKKTVLTEGYDQPLRKKFNNILQLLENEHSNVTNHNDENITFYLSIAKLKEEMESKV